MITRKACAAHEEFDKEEGDDLNEERAQYLTKRKLHTSIGTTTFGILCCLKLLDTCCFNNEMNLCI